MQSIVRLTFPRCGCPGLAPKRILHDGSCDAFARCTAPSRPAFLALGKKEPHQFAAFRPASDAAPRIATGHGILSESADSRRMKLTFLAIQFHGLTVRLPSPCQPGPTEILNPGCTWIIKRFAEIARGNESYVQNFAVGRYICVGERVENPKPVRMRGRTNGAEEEATGNKSPVWGYRENTTSSSRNNRSQTAFSDSRFAQTTRLISTSLAARERKKTQKRDGRWKSYLSEKLLNLSIVFFSTTSADDRDYTRIVHC